MPTFAPEAVLRSALCLKLHIFSDTGAIIAAATTSIPESLDSVRTWDYRFCWLRDAAFVVEALRRLSHFGEGVTGLSGEPADIHALTDALGLFFEKSGGGPDYTVSHSTAVLVIDPEAELQAIFSTPHAVDAFVHDLPLLMASQ